MPLSDVLIPTMGRRTALAITLTSLLGQTFRDFSVVIADQTPDLADSAGSPEVATNIPEREHEAVALLPRRLAELD